MTINVSEALDFDTGTTVSLENSSGGSYVGGKFQAGLPNIRKALASIQQPTPKQLEFLQGGERTKDIKTFYLNKEVITSEGDKTATIITHRSKKYKVVFAGDWEDFGWFFAMGAKIQ